MKNFIEDLLNQLINRAIDLKSDLTEEFDTGKLFAYYEIISTIFNQLEAFGMTEEIPERLRNFNVEDLIKK